MNLSSSFGILLGLIILLVSLGSATSSYRIFLDAHAILIVIGGTTAAAFIAYPISMLKTLLTVFVKKVMAKQKDSNTELIDEVVELSKGSREDSNYLETHVTKIKNPFLREGVELIVKGGVTPERFDKIMKKRAFTHARKHDQEAGVFKTLSKFPPAFGLLGTTLGMIGLLQNLGSPDSFKTLGPTMAIGLVATLYGIVVANLVLIPIGENLTKLNREDIVTREIVIEGLRLLQEKEHPSLVFEELKSYLMARERSKLKAKAS